MKFSILALTTCALSMAAAAPVETPVEETNFTLDTNSIVGLTDLTDDLEPVLTEFNGTKVLLLVNTTIADAEEASQGGDVEKREAGWGWVKYRPFEPIAKRDANAEAKWGWVNYRPFEPIAKRDANAEAKWGWVKYRPFEPIAKREAEPEAEPEAGWGWVKYRPFEPIAKREAEPEAGWGWVKYRPFEPIA